MGWNVQGGRKRREKGNKMRGEEGSKEDLERRGGYSKGERGGEG